MTQSSLHTNIPTLDNLESSSELSPEQVSIYLRQNPLFFHEHQSLLLSMSIPHESGKAISLVERQVTMFRERQAQLQDHFHVFLSNAHANDNLFEKTRVMILALLKCSSLTAIYNLIFQHFPEEFHAAAAGIVLINERGVPSHSPLPHIFSSAARTALGELYQKPRTYCGPLNKVQSELLFPLHSELLLSAAIVPLPVNADTAAKLNDALPILIVGSTEREHFNSSLDTLFLDFLGEVLTLHIQNILKA